MTKGFTLLETVMALAILGVASGTLITVFSESLQRIRHSERVIQGTALAQSLLARVEAGEMLLSNSGSVGAAEGGFFWTIQTQPYGSDQDRSAWIMQPRTMSCVSHGIGFVRVSVVLALQIFMSLFAVALYMTVYFRLWRLW